MNAKDIAHELVNQDNACTADPIFVVQRRVFDYGYDPDYTEDAIAWLDEEGHPITATSNAAQFAKFEAGVFDGDEEGREEMWTRTGFRTRWEFVQPFLTRKAAEQFRADQAHNLGETRVYVESACRNPEWKWLRSFLAEHA